MIRPATEQLSEQVMAEKIKKFYETMNEELDKEAKQRAPQVVSEMLPNYECPNCQMPMMIGGRYPRKPKEEQSEGKSKDTQHQCHQCNQRITPKRLTEYNEKKN